MGLFSSFFLLFDRELSKAVLGMLALSFWLMNRISQQISADLSRLSQWFSYQLVIVVTDSQQFSISFLQSNSANP